MNPLVSIPGLQVAQTGQRGGEASLFIRGGNSNSNKVLIDGVPVNDIGGLVNFGNLSLTAIDYLEVFRGPNSVLYGSDALAGVVSMTTARGYNAVARTLLCDRWRKLWDLSSAGHAGRRLAAL